MKLRRFLRIFAVLFTLSVFAPMAGAISFDLDSIAAWGKFPRFCINTYRWGDKFFNTYDSTYVVGSGCKFNVKATSDSFLDYYLFQLPDQKTVTLQSDPSTSIGAYITYMALSWGYDINVSSLFGGVNHARSRYRLGFNCSLLSAEAYWQTNDVSTTMTRFGDDRDLDLPFDGVKVHTWGIDVYYYFNHKRYSQSASFSFGKIQKRSQGSFYAGLSFFSQDFDFDFSELPQNMLDELPEWWDGYHYMAHTKNLGFRLGYGYNWVFAPKWVLGVTVSPTVGIRWGMVNSSTDKTSFSLLAKGGLSVVWNHNRWFAGVIGKIDSAIIADRSTLYTGNTLSVSASVGYRFNIW